MDPSTGIYEYVSQLSGPVAYCTIVGILLLCGFGLPVPEDITLVSAGLIASAGSISLSGAMLAGFAGVLTGDAVLFFLGRRFGKRLFALGPFRRVFTPERIDKAEARIRKHGPFICFIARFLPGLRAPIFATSGALGVKPSTFFALDGLAALLSVPFWVYVGFWFGENYEDAFSDALDAAAQMQGYLFAGLAAIVVGYIIFKKISKQRSV